MSFWPVIIRELHTEARRPFNYWLRLVGVGAITVVLAASLFNLSGSAAALGARLFGNLNATLFIGIWVLAPMLTADCISQEKRDGTLGLLFLTRLTASGIVIGKSLIHALRSTTLLLGVMPVLAVPFLLGGVSWKDGVLALLLDASAVSLALTAGLLASTAARNWERALVLALLISFAFAALFMLVHYLGCTWLEMRMGARTAWGAKDFHQAFRWFWSQDFLFRLTQTFLVCTNLPGEYLYFRSTWGSAMGGYWTQTWAAQTAAYHCAWMEWAGLLLGGSILILTCAVGIAACCIRRSWRDEPVSRRKLWLLETFCTPKFWRPVFRNRMSRTLDRNPIGWLQQYSWSDRLTKWGWCLLVVVLECVVSDASLRWLWSGQYVLAQMLMLGLAFTASGSFRLEKETGALELLLVTPLDEGQVIGGRLRGLWSQFFPATLCLALAWLWLAKDALWFSPFGYEGTDVWSESVFPVFFVTTFLTLPMVGLYFSMCRLNFIAAWLMTCLTNVLLPFLIYALVRSVAVDWTQAIVCLLLAQVSGALAGWYLLDRDLRDRSFSLGARALKS